MVYTFGDFELDAHRRELRRGGDPRHVEPQVFDVLLLLARHRDRVVTRRELLEAVWGHTFVSDATLSSRIKSARRAVGDSGEAQAVIRTLHGRGYRFVAPVEERAAPAPADLRPAVAPVGRDGPLEMLQRLLDEACGGARRVAFVSGEAGIGKTTLIDCFAARARATPGLRTAHGQCLDQRGAGEPYLPVLEALARIGEGSERAALVTLLQARAPTWLAQLPGLLPPGEAAAVAERARGATRERMLREFVGALEAWTAARPLVLVLEDLHWSDPSTLQLIDGVARRREPARLLVVGTYRPAEVRVGGHPLHALVEELRVRELCADLELEALSVAAVREYLERRFPGAPFAAELHRPLHARTEGNPLFLRSLVDAWVARGALVRGDAGWERRADPVELAAEVPPTLARLIQQQVQRLPPAQQAVLEAASVAGTRFSAAAAAAALERPVGEVEETCDTLARQGRFLRAGDVERWPDGTVSGRYAFVHHLHRQVVYTGISGGRRATLHRRIGARVEAAYGADPAERAAELALHFTEGEDGPRAAEYLRRAAEQALARSAHQEAIEHLRRALGILREHPGVPDAARREITLLRMLGPALVAVRGWNDPEAETAFARARALCEEAGDVEQLARVLYGLAYVHEIRGEYQVSQALVEERFRLPLRAEAPGPRIESYELLACSLFHQGAFGDAVETARRGMRLYRADAAPADGANGEHAGVACHYWAGLALWFLGRPDGAARSLETAVRLAARSEHLYMLAMARAHLAQLFHLRGEPERVLAPAREALALAERQGYPYQRAIAQAMLGWGCVLGGETEDGLARIRDGLDTEDAIGAAMERPYFLGVLADALAAAHRTDEGLAVAEQALERVRATGRSFFWEAELHRVRAVLLAQRAHPDAAEVAAQLQAAREVARRQGAPALEIRALLSMAGLPAAGSATGRSAR